MQKCKVCGIEVKCIETHIWQKHTERPSIKGMGVNEGGMCLCGCGNKTSIARDNNKRKGWIKGKPKWFMNHHNGRIWKAETVPTDNCETKPCECGCGMAAPIAPKTVNKWGWIRGKPKRFIHGHATKRRKERPEAIAKRVESTKITNQSPETKRRRAEAIKRRWHDPELRLRDRTQSPEARRKRRESQSQPRMRQATSERMKLLWADPEYRMRLTAIRQCQNSNPETIKKMQEATARIWSDPEFRRKNREARSRVAMLPEVRQNNSNAAKRRWKNPEYVRKQMRSRGVRPNKPEMELNSLLQDIYPNEWKYVGDGQVIIDGKCPDFININGKKQIIELFGDYWHKGKKPEDRVKIFKPYGYETMVIWEKELNDIEGTKSRIHEFHNSENYS